MSLFISIIFLLNSVICFGFDRKILNPLFINSFLWGFLLLLYNILPHNLYVLNEQFLLAIFLWVFMFSISNLLFQSSKGIEINLDIYNKNVFNIFFYVVIIFGPISLLKLIIEAMSVGPELFFLRLRMINTGLDEQDTFSLGAYAYIFNFANIVCLIFTFYSNKISNKKYYLVLIIAFLLGIVTLARTSILMLIISIFVIKYFQNTIRYKHYVYFFLLIISFLIIITILRGQGENAGSFLNTLAIYLLGGMPAFDTVNHQESIYFGEYTFRFFYAIFSVFDKTIVAKDTILPYVNIPTETNVYTVLFPFYKDFGFIGVSIFAFIYGTIFGFIYKYALKGISFYVIICAFIMPCFLFQFFGEYIFLNLSTYIQYLVILLIPYIFKIQK